jgi:hypothetical protein
MRQRLAHSTFTLNIKRTASPRPKATPLLARYPSALTAGRSGPICPSLVTAACYSRGRTSVANSYQRAFHAISTTIGSDQMGQRFLQECWGSALRWLASILAVMHTARSHLNLRNDRIGAAGAESFAGVLTKCPVLVQCWLTSI